MRDAYTGFRVARTLEHKLRSRYDSLQFPIQEITFLPPYRGGLGSTRVEHPNMTMRSSILGLMIASSIAVGLANADESNQNESRWTGFYVGANGGLARSDSKEALAFGAQGSSVGGSQNAGSNAFSSDLTGHDLQSRSLGMGLESEISKALGSGK